MTRGISWPALWLGIIGFGILYVPVTVMVIYSFNSSRLVSVWAGFSTKWYGELLENDAVLEALGKSLHTRVAKKLRAHHILVDDAWPPKELTAAPQASPLASPLASPPEAPQDA